MVDPPMVAMNRFLYDLCWEVARGDLAPHKCKPVLESVNFEGGDKDKNEMASVLADVVAHMGQDITMPGENRARLVKLAKWLVESSTVPSRFFQERCEEEFLWDSEMIKIKAQDLKTKEVRVNTRLLYQQTKFNLLREESEGYAKLMTLLCEGGLELQSDNSLTARISVIKSLIGHFDLDPNRVFDIVLDCFELYPDNNIFYRLIPMFPKSHAAQILGFKFQFYQRLEVKATVPFSLYRITALLIKAEFIDLNFIYAHLLPKDDEAYDHYDAFVSKRFEEVNKIGKINLAATGKDLMDDEKQDVTVDLYTALDMESEAVAERVPDIENDQRLGLLMGFLSVDDWYHAHILFERLSNLNPVAHIQISEGLFRIIEKGISCAYAAICQVRIDNLGTLSDTTGLVDTPVYQSGIIDLPRDLFQMLTAVGPYLYRYTILLQKVCRVLRAYYLAALELSSIDKSKVHDLNCHDPHLRLKEARLRVEEALGLCLLPSLQLIPANPAVGQEIWELLSLLPYEARYRLYGEWEKDDEKFPMVLAARQIAKLDTRRILKRLAKENLKPLGRMVAKLAHSNPMTVLRTIVQQIEAYRDMIVPVVDAFKYLTQVEYDALEYVVIERLAQGGRDKLKDDGLNLSDWLQSLASFWGHLCKKYPSMELRGLFQYLVNQLKRGSGVELVLLQELVQQMANVHYTENMTEEQLDAMAGSETLRYQATLFGMTRNNKALSKSTNRLRDSLLPKDEPKLAIPLLLLIAQHRSMVIINADVPHIKMVSEQFDRCHGTLLQYVDFLSSALPSVTYAQLVPPLGELVHKYHLEPEVAFLIYRPVMRLFKSSNELEVYWPLDNYKESGTPQQNEDELSSSPIDFILDLGVTQKPVMWIDLLDTVSSMLPKKAWNSLSPDLYATFWGLTLYDLYVPRNRYESEIAKQHAAIKALEEISDNSSIAITKRKKEKERIQEILDRLSSELQKHEEHVASVRRHLGREKDKWLSSCSDISKINIEFLQRCIFPRCIFSMQDAIYCSMFVHTLHSLATPFFNMVNHIDVIICKFLHPMICCCTEYEAGRLGRFLYETLRMAYYWKSDESIYERECGSMPGFAVYIRFPDSQRVTFGQFVRVNWKWSAKMTRLLIQCMESSEYMEIRNALIILTKISSVFPVMRKSGLNLEKRVLKIKGDEREDLKVLATGVAAALAARKSSWVTEEDFGMGFIDLKPASSPKKILVNNQRKVANGSINESTGTRSQTSGNQNLEQAARVKLNDSRLDRVENSLSKSDSSQQLSKVHSMSNGSESQQPLSSSHIQLGNSRPSKITEEHVKAIPEETAIKGSSKIGMEAETRPQTKRSVLNASEKPTKQDTSKDEVKSGKSISRSTNQLSATADRDISTHAAEGRQGGNPASSSASNNNVIMATGKVSSSKIVDGSDDSTVKVQKRANIVDDPERSSKRKKSDMEGKDGQNLDVKSSDKEKIYDARASERGADEQNVSRTMEKLQERSKDKASEKYDKDHKEKVDRPDKSRDDMTEKQRDRSMERYGRERSIDRTSERGADRSTDKSRDEKSKDERSKPRHAESSLHVDERFSGQNLPPPPPLPPSFVPQSLTRREEDADRRAGSSRHIQRLSPRHDEKEHRRAEESVLASHDDTKRRRDDDLRDKKRDERDLASVKVDDRDKDKTITLKDDLDATGATKRRKLKKDHHPSEAGEYSPVVPPLPLSRATNAAQSFDARERGDSKGLLTQHRTSYMEEQIPRVHSKETTSKLPRRDMDQHDREWDDEKRHRTEAKRKHRK